MRELDIFNFIRVVTPEEIRPLELASIKYGGFLTVTANGSNKALLNQIKTAYKTNLTCFNIVNTENSPITRIIDELRKEMDEDEKKAEADKPQVLFDLDDSDDADSQGKDEFVDKNIGLYQKSGHCYSDIKCFIPQVICLAMVALWFSDKKQGMMSMNDKQKVIESRKDLVQDIGYMSLRLKQTLQPSFIQ